MKKLDILDSDRRSELHSRYFDLALLSLLLGAISLIVGLAIGVIPRIFIPLGIALFLLSYFFNDHSVKYISRG